MKDTHSGVGLQWPILERKYSVKPVLKYSILCLYAKKDGHIATYCTVDVVYRMLTLEPRINSIRHKKISDLWVSCNHKGIMGFMVIYFMFFHDLDIFTTFFKGKG